MTFTKRKLLAFACICLAASGYAQFVNYGTDPSSLKWNIVRTDHYKLIYPQGNDSMAYRYARLLETSYPYVAQTIGASRNWKFPVVLHPGNMLSNGMVAWAPRRMELITTPSSDLYAQSWDRQLVVHESRHVLQTTKFMKGIFSPLYCLAGDQTAAIPSLLVPTWFLEGDAVATETALSNSGRGRLPEFHMIYRARYASGDFYKPDKWFLGSYKDYTGTYYALGYNLTSYARHRYGADIWDKTTDRYIKRFFSLPPFSNALRHYTGGSTKELFVNTFSFLNREWEKQDSLYHRSGFEPDYLTAAQEGYTTYRYPQAINNRTVIAVKGSMADISSLVAIENGNERRLAYLGSINSRIIYSNNRVYWTENVSGIRWRHLNHSVLKYYDMKTGRIRTLTPGQRYQSPSISQSGAFAAVSEFSPAGENRVVILDTSDGAVVRAFPVPSNAFAKEIAYLGDEELAVAGIHDGGISIWKLDSSTGDWDELLSPTWANISAMSWDGGRLLFESGVDGTNNIYSMDIRSKETSKLTTARFGAFTPTLSANKKQLVFSDYQTDGYRLASVDLDSLRPARADFANPYKFPLAESIRQQENFNIDTTRLKEVDFRPRRYSKALHLFRVHSWSPFYYDVSNLINLNMDDFSSIVKPGAMVLSQNSLNTAIAQAGWYYKDGHHYGKMAFTYMGWYPVVDVNVTYGGKAFEAVWGKDESGNDIIGYQDPNRNLLEVEAQVYIPFDLTRNHYTRGIQPSVTYYYTNNGIQKHSGTKFYDFQYIIPEVRMYSYRKMAARDILPRWGYQLRLQMLSTLTGSSNFGELYAARLTAYLPGLLPNNSLMLRAGYQYQPVGRLYVPKQLLDAPRGYSYSSVTHQLLAFRSDYAFTLLYPEWSVGSLAYIKRLRSNLFYDMSFNWRSKSDSRKSQSSYGVDLLFDWHALQSSDFLITTGVRLMNPVQKSGLSGEILFSVSY